MGYGVLIVGKIKFRGDTSEDIIKDALENVNLGLGVSTELRRYGSYHDYLVNSQANMPHYSYIEDDRTLRFVVLDFSGDVWEDDIEAMLSVYKKHLDKEGTFIEFYSLSESGGWVDFDSIPDPTVESGEGVVE